MNKYQSSKEKSVSSDRFSIKDNAEMLTKF